jgi:hypothetical protein
MDMFWALVGWGLIVTFVGLIAYDTARFFIELI